jgi:hypothetical protein
MNVGSGLDIPVQVFFETFLFLQDHHSQQKKDHDKNLYSHSSGFINWTVFIGNGEPINC